MPPCRFQSAGGGTRTRTGLHPMVFETILSPIPTRRRYNDCSWTTKPSAHDCVQPSNVRLSCNRNRSPVHLSPAHPETLACHTENSLDIGRIAGKHVARIGIYPLPQPVLNIVYQAARLPIFNLQLARIHRFAYRLDQGHHAGQVVVQHPFHYCGAHDHAVGHPAGLGRQGRA